MDNNGAILTGASGTVLRQQWGKTQATMGQHSDNNGSVLRQPLAQYSDNSGSGSRQQWGNPKTTVGQYSDNSGAIDHSRAIYNRGEGGGAVLTTVGQYPSVGHYLDNSGAILRQQWGNT